MCIICISGKGAPQPTESTIRTMFTNNPHGAGYMTARDGKVLIHKGFMTIDDLLRAIAAEHFTSSDVVVYHFRISTQAGVNPYMTQPFPMSPNGRHLKALDLSCSIGLAHNGIIPMTSDGNKEFSDTALFAAHYLPKLIRRKADLLDPAILDLLSVITKSRLALLDGSGTVATVGSWTTDTATGLLYSNDSYKPKAATPFRLDTLPYNYGWRCKNA